MTATIIKPSNDQPVSETQILEAFLEQLGGRAIKNALLLPPDISRVNSMAGPIVTILYKYFTSAGARVTIMPALGSHVPMSDGEIDEMYPGIPHSHFAVHNWRQDVVKLGRIPGDFVREASGGWYSRPIDVELNKLLLDPDFDVIISVGQVVPHEVAGMANYTKNLFVGCGGSGMINASHYLSALYGMENIMGRDHTPAHKIFDYAAGRFTAHLPVLYALTVTTPSGGGPFMECLSVGFDRDAFEAAVAVSREKNINFLGREAKKVVAYMDPREFKRTWISNKAIYRSRMAIADGGELTVIAPGLKGFGEDAENDRLIRKYGYCGRERLCKLAEENGDLQNNLSAAAHIIHSSSDGRFTITYAPGHLSKEEIESVGYQYTPLAEALEKYGPERLRTGFHSIGGEEFYFIKNPALGLWAFKERFKPVGGDD